MRNKLGGLILVMNPGGSPCYDRIRKSFQNMRPGRCPTAPSPGPAADRVLIQAHGCARRNIERQGEVVSLPFPVRAASGPKANKQRTRTREAPCAGKPPPAMDECARGAATLRYKAVDPVANSILASSTASFTSAWSGTRSIRTSGIAHAQKNPGAGHYILQGRELAAAST